MMDADLHICPLCGHESKSLFVSHGFPVRECRNCGHQFADVPFEKDHVASVYSDTYFSCSLSGGYSDYLADAQLLFEHGKRYGELMSKLKVQGPVLDVGSAAGFILKGFIEAGWEGSGLEPNAKMAAFARDRLGLTVATSSFEDFKATSSYGLVSLIQVVGHFKDPRGIFEKAGQLVENGHILVETWNRDSWPAKLLGRHWHEYSPPSVLHFFSADRLRLLLADYGFVEVARGVPAKYIYASHAKNLLRYKTATSAIGRIALVGASVLPDQMKIRYPSFDLLWMLFKRER